MDSRDQDKCNQKNLDDYKQKIRALNDEFRKNRKGGYLRTTDGIAALGYWIRTRPSIASVYGCPKSLSWVYRQIAT